MNIIRKSLAALALVCLLPLAGCNKDSGAEVKSETTPPNAGTAAAGKTAPTGANNVKTTAPEPQ